MTYPEDFSKCRKSGIPAFEPAKIPVKPPHSDLNFWKVFFWKVHEPLYNISLNHKAFWHTVLWLTMTHHGIFENFEEWILMNERPSKILTQPVQTQNIVWIRDPRTVMAVTHFRGRIFNVKIGTRLLTTTLLLSHGSLVVNFWCTLYTELNIWSLFSSSRDIMSITKIELSTFAECVGHFNKTSALVKVCIYIFSDSFFLLKSLFQSCLYLSLSFSLCMERVVSDSAK